MSRNIVWVVEGQVEGSKQWITTTACSPQRDEVVKAVKQFRSAYAKAVVRHQFRITKYEAVR